MSFHRIMGSEGQAVEQELARKEGDECCVVLCHVENRCL